MFFRHFSKQFTTDVVCGIVVVPFFGLYSYTLSHVITKDYNNERGKTFRKHCLHFGIFTGLVVTTMSTKTKPATLIFATLPVVTIGQMVKREFSSAKPSKNEPKKFQEEERDLKQCVKHI